MRGVLDDGEIPPPRDRGDRRHVGHLPVQVHGQDRARSSGDRGLDRPRVYVARRAVDIGEDRRRAGHHDAVRRSDEGEGARDDFVSLADARGQQREMHGRRAARHGDGVGKPEIGGESALELGDLVPRREEERAENTLDPTELLRPEIVLAVLDFFLHAVPSIACKRSCASA